MDKDTAVDECNAVAEAPEPSNNVYGVIVRVCQACIDLKGQECHEPACVFCFHGMDEVKWLLDKMLICPIIDGERIVLAGDGIDDPPKTEGVNESGVIQAMLERCREREFAAKKEWERLQDAHADTFDLNVARYVWQESHNFLTELQRIAEAAPAVSVSKDVSRVDALLCDVLTVMNRGEYHQAHLILQQSVVGAKARAVHAPVSVDVRGAAERAAARVFRKVEAAFDYAGEEDDERRTIKALADIIAAEFKDVAPVRDSPDEQFLEAVLAEVKRARAKFPGTNATNCALVEEVGEVSKALMFEPWNQVVAECVQVATMALRLATEGDSTMEDWRRKTIHGGDYSRYGSAEHIMPTAPAPQEKESE